MQDGFPVAYYSKKLNSAQMNYTTIDRELLCVIATLREFCPMLLGAELHIHTDHKNILNVGDSSERRLRWTSYVDEYQYKTIRGTKYCNRYQYSKTYCSYIHLIQILHDLHSGEISVKFLCAIKFILI